MTLVSLNEQDAVDLPVKATFRHASLRQDGDASVFVPRASPAFTAAHIDERDAFPVVINLGRVGVWPGIGMAVAEDEDGIDIDCVHWSRLLKSAIVSRGRSFRSLPAGEIARQAVLEAFASLGAGVLTPGVFSYGAPLVDYTFDGQDVGQVFTDLQEATGQEPEITALTVNWLPPIATGYAPWLSQGDALVSPKRGIDHTDRVFQVTARDSAGRELSARLAPIRGPWKPVRLLDSDATTSVTLALDGLAELNANLHADHTWTAGLRDTGTLWADIREGMTLKLATRIGFSETCPVVRVLARTYSEGSAVLDLELQRLPPPVGGLASVGQAVPVPGSVKPQGTTFQNQFWQIAKQVLGVQPLG